MMKWYNSNRLLILGAAAGALAGFIYWYKIGCASGSCLITSKPLNSSLYGSLMGALLFSMFKKERNKEAVTKKDDESLPG